MLCMRNTCRSTFIRLEEWYENEHLLHMNTYPACTTQADPRSFTSRNDTKTANFLFCLLCIALKRYSTDRGTMPRSSPCQYVEICMYTWEVFMGIHYTEWKNAGVDDLHTSSPKTVYVLPLPVWPYANMQPLKPSRTCSTCRTSPWCACCYVLWKMQRIIYHVSEEGKRTVGINFYRRRLRWVSGVVWPCLCVSFVLCGHAQRCRM